MKQLLALSIFYVFIGIITGCSSAALDSHKPANYPDESLINTYWRLVTLNERPVVTPENVREAHLVLHRDLSRLAGATGCNTLMGSYRVEKERITFNNVATTKIACSTQQMDTEHDLVAALKLATEWKVSGNKLLIIGDSDEQLASFEAVHLF